MKNEKMMEMSTKVFMHYFDSVMDAVKRDFDVFPVDGEREKTEKWFQETVDFLMSHPSGTIIGTDAVFSDYEE